MYRLHHLFSCVTKHSWDRCWTATVGFHIPFLETRRKSLVYIQRPCIGDLVANNICCWCTCKSTVAIPPTFVHVCYHTVEVTVVCTQYGKMEETLCCCCLRAPGSRQFLLICILKVTCTVVLTLYLILCFNEDFCKVVTKLGLTFSCLQCA